MAEKTLDGLMADLTEPKAARDAACAGAIAAIASAVRAQKADPAPAPELRSPEVRNATAVLAFELADAARERAPRSPADCFDDVCDIAVAAIESAGRGSIDKALEATSLDFTDDSLGRLVGKAVDISARRLAGEGCLLDGWAGPMPEISPSQAALVAFALYRPRVLASGEGREGVLAAYSASRGLWVRVVKSLLLWWEEGLRWAQRLHLSREFKDTLYALAEGAGPLGQSTDADLAWFDNGVVDIAAGELRPFSPELVSLAKSRAVWHDDAEPPEPSVTLTDGSAVKASEVIAGLGGKSVERAFYQVAGSMLLRGRAQRRAWWFYRAYGEPVAGIDAAEAMMRSLGCCHNAMGYFGRQAPEGRHARMFALNSLMVVKYDESWPFLRDGGAMAEMLRRRPVSVQEKFDRERSAVVAAPQVGFFDAAPDFSRQPAEVRRRALCVPVRAPEPMRRGLLSLNDVLGMAKTRQFADWLAWRGLAAIRESGKVMEPAEGGRLRAGRR